MIPGGTFMSRSFYYVENAKGAVDNEKRYCRRFTTRSFLRRIIRINLQR
jgi:hypothetical protein